MEINEELKSLIKENKRLLKEIKERYTLSDVGNPDRLLTSHEVLRRLNMKPTQKGWKQVKEIMCTRYGFTRKPGLGYRITNRNFNKFLREEFEQHKS